ncbi:hypothetical protein [Burkholderia lata]|uniref:hypothetical protein n=1 Tax=Burkholderia lata (strain ATCC 17760 / DSM 23089 / LMG 22485 / NCIMB 9086 / R18194 / 383) TaxID=482957 RepID=UPI001583E95E|nr:hypothetical protein [Burkholderia lata]
MTIATGAGHPAPGSGSRSATAACLVGLSAFGDATIKDSSILERVSIGHPRAIFIALRICSIRDREKRNESLRPGFTETFNESLKNDCLNLQYIE